MKNSSDTAADFVRDLGNAARNNPLSAALIGMGVLWLFTGGRPVGLTGDLLHRTGADQLPDMARDSWSAASSGLRSAAESIGERASATAEAVRAGGSSTLDRASQAGSEYVDRASEYARTLPGSGAELFDSARSNLSELFHAQPLALGVVGLAIGAGIAAAIPTTEIEGAYLGETSDLVKSRASELAGEQVDRATTVAKDVVGAVTEEARKQGLTTDGLKSAVGAIPEKVARVVDAAKSGSERTV